MIQFIIKRMAYMIATLFIIASLTFFLMKLMPGTPLSMSEKLTAEQEEIILEKYGLLKPVPVQYLIYMGRLLQGDLGVSFQFDNRPVTTLVLDKIGPSAQLGFQALLLGTCLGVLLGVFSAVKHNTMMDHASTIIAVLGKSIPNFIFAGLLQYYIGIKLQLLPVAFWEGFRYTILPTIALAMFPMAVTARFMRTEMIDVLNQDYMLTARAKGLNRKGIIIRHGLRNALIPIITLLGPLSVSLMTGSLVVENIFAIPGLGDQFVRSIKSNDYPMIMGTTLLYSTFLILVLFIVDLLYGIVDPRIRLARGRDLD